MAGKKFEAAKALVDRSKVYNYKEGIALAKKTNWTKFDASVEVSFVLNVDPRQADQNIRGAIVLPNGNGKTQRVLVITQGAKLEEATAAVADLVGGADKIVATPDMMGQLGKLGRLLGPKGLMPNPKTGTVTMDVAKAVDDIKKGKAEYRVDRDGNVNVMIGKCSFTDEQLAENFKTLYDQILKVRPNSVKGGYIKSVTLSTTMGPGIKVSVE